VASTATTYWVGAAGWHYLFHLLRALFPPACGLLDIAEGTACVPCFGRPSFSCWRPVIGLVVTAAIATGEPRYRIPFDSCS